ncbi:endonuclease-reverse transcriptase [Plakobranchus ocellatus]|uniref:Endonuclease-reverse transcriptase n=1 Tax=Plakobranchus ocellatus TaxID=259542 RepID=A0AAV4DRZ5_9GAST|nr:endonuclease-reverse transcriptase [Plakobranchus ocellatus]
MLKVILNRLKPEADKIIVEEQAGFRPGRSTVEKICNVRILMENLISPAPTGASPCLHRFKKKTFDRVWHEALWSTMREYNINSNFISVIENLYNKATSAVFYNNNIGDWFRTIVGVRQGCLLSPTLFNIFLERIMTDALEDHCGTVSIGGRPITNLRFADEIDGLAVNACELASLLEQLEKASSNFGMEINAEKTKIMTNSKEPSKKEIKINDHITNEEVSRRIENAIGPHVDLLTIVRQRKLKWYRHTTRSSYLAKTIMQGTVNGGRRRGRQKKRWGDNIREWTGLEVSNTLRKAEDREKWKAVVRRSSAAPRWTPNLRNS